MGRPRKPDAKQPVSVRLRPSTLVRLERFAEALGATTSEAIETAVESFLASDLASRAVEERSEARAEAAAALASEQQAIEALRRLAPSAQRWVIEALEAAHPALVEVGVEPRLGLYRHEGTELRAAVEALGEKSFRALRRNDTLVGQLRARLRGQPARVPVERRSALRRHDVSLLAKAEYTLRAKAEKTGSAVERKRLHALADECWDEIMLRGSVQPTMVLEETKAAARAALAQERTYEPLLQDAAWAHERAEEAKAGPQERAHERSTVLTDLDRD